MIINIIIIIINIPIVILIFMYGLFSLCSSKDSPYLHSGLRQSQSLAELLPHEGVRVVGLVEEPLQLVELLQREVSPTSPLLDFSLCLVLYGLRVLLPFLHVRVACVAGGKRGRHQRRGAAQGPPARPPSVHVCQIF